MIRLFQSPLLNTEIHTNVPPINMQHCVTLELTFGPTCGRAGRPPARAKGKDNIFCAGESDQFRGLHHNG